MILRGSHKTDFVGTFNVTLVLCAATLNERATFRR